MDDLEKELLNYDNMGTTIEKIKKPNVSKFNINNFIKELENNLDNFDNIKDNNDDDIINTLIISEYKEHTGPIFYIILINYLKQLIKNGINNCKEYYHKFSDDYNNIDSFRLININIKNKVILHYYNSNLYIKKVIPEINYQ